VATGRWRCGIGARVFTEQYIAIGGGELVITKAESATDGVRQFLASQLDYMRTEALQNIHSISGTLVAARGHHRPHATRCWPPSTPARFSPGLSRCSPRSAERAFTDNFALLRSIARSEIQIGLVRPLAGRASVRSNRCQPSAANCA
jgi:hypothetical protein